jgi:hypothetical protein
VKGNQKELDDILSKYELDVRNVSLTIMLYEILKELKRLRMNQ